MKQDHSLPSPKRLVLRVGSVCSGLRTHFSLKKSKKKKKLQFTNRSSEKDIEGELKQKQFRENWRGDTAFTKKNILVLKIINLPQ